MPLGGTVLLYTDGLVERPGELLDDGLDRLAAAVRGERTGPRSSATTSSSGWCRPPELADDVALLALCSPRLSDSFRLELGSEPGELAAMRTLMRRWLRNVDGDDVEIAEILTAIGEAAANAIEHGGSIAGGPPFEVIGSVDGDASRSSSRDSGAGWRERRSSEGGRGLVLMRALMDSVDVDTGHRRHHRADGRRLGRPRELELASQPVFGRLLRCLPTSAVSVSSEQEAPESPAARCSRPAGSTSTVTRRGRASAGTGATATTTACRRRTSRCSSTRRGRSWSTRPTRCRSPTRTIRITPDRRLLRRLRRPLRLPRQDPLRHRGDARAARARGRLGRRVAPGRRRRRGDRPLRRRDGRQRPPLGPALARAGVSRRARRFGRGHPRPLLPQLRGLRGQERARARDRQLRLRHRRRDLARLEDDLPVDAPRRLDRPQVRRLDADRRDRSRMGSRARAVLDPAAVPALVRSSASRATRPPTACRSPTTGSPRPIRPSPPTCCRGSATAGSPSGRTSSGSRATRSASSTARSSRSTRSSTARATRSASRSSTTTCSTRPATTGSSCTARSSTPTSRASTSSA